MDNSRRQFFKQALGSVGAIVAAPVLLRTLLPSVAQAQAPVVPGSFVVPGQGMAASVGYVEDKKKVAKDKQIDRNGTKFADQSCTNCALFVKEPNSANGKCALFPNQLVKPTSFCNSWAKKPAK